MPSQLPIVLRGAVEDFVCDSWNNERATCAVCANDCATRALVLSSSRYCIMQGQEAFVAPGVQRKSHNKNCERWDGWAGWNIMSYHDCWKRKRPTWFLALFGDFKQIVIVAAKPPSSAAICKGVLPMAFRTWAQLASLSKRILMTSWLPCFVAWSSVRTNYGET